jgi:hypothetical protein
MRARTAAVTSTPTSKAVVCVVDNKELETGIIETIARDWVL